MEPEDDIDIDMPGALSAALAADRKNRQLVEQQIRSNMDALTQARDSIRQQRVGPSAAERLYAISAALGRPTRTGRFSESMANLGETLGAQEKAKREAMAARDAMAEKYGMDIGESQLSMLQSQLAGSGQMVNRALAAAKPSRGTWSETLGQFVNQDQPVPTQTKVNVGGLIMTQYTDGNLYLNNPDGSKSVYNRAGEKIRDIPAKGAR
jgi:hypothetical protein